MMKKKPLLSNLIQRYLMVSQSTWCNLFFQSYFYFAENSKKTVTSADSHKMVEIHSTSQEHKIFAAQKRRIKHAFLKFVYL